MNIIEFITSLIFSFEHMNDQKQIYNTSIDFDKAMEYLNKVESGRFNNITAEYERRFYDPVHSPQHFAQWGKYKDWKVITGIDEEYNHIFVATWWNEAKYISDNKLAVNHPRTQGMIARIKDYYFKEYWLKSGADKYPSPYNLLVFDAYVQGQNNHITAGTPEQIIQARIDSYNQNSQVHNREGWITLRMKELTNFIMADKNKISFNWIDGAGHVNTYIA